MKLVRNLGGERSAQIGRNKFNLDVIPTEGPRAM
jgi:hypothetical protein